VFVVAIEKITDQALLTEIALTAKDSWFGCAAVKKITDQTLLAKIVLKSHDESLRRSAIRKITDPGIKEKLKQLKPELGRYF